MGQEEKTHKGHENHLCHLQNTGFILKNWEGYKTLVYPPSYICSACGRMAKNGTNLCAPEKLQ